MNDKIKKRCIRGAIFDVDGTLLDSMKIWDNAGERYLQSRGRQAEPGLSRILFSMSLADGATYLKETYELPETTGEIHQGILDIVDAFYWVKRPPQSFAMMFLLSFCKGRCHDHRHVQ